MTGLAFAVWSVVYGLTFGNLSEWAAPVRAGLYAALALFGLIAVRRRVTLGDGALYGVLAAFGVSNAYHTLGNVAPATWLTYAGVYLVQRVTRRVTVRDLGMAGLAWCVTVIVWRMIQPGGEAMRPLNYVYVGVMVTSLAPAMLTSWRWSWPLVAGALVLAGSRSAIAGFAVAAGVMYLDSIPRQWLRASLVAAIPAAAALVMIRPQTVAARLDLIDAAVHDWWAASPVFGSGLIDVAGWRVGDAATSHHAHNVTVSLLAQNGLAGLGMIGAAVTVIRRRVTLDRWQWATLAACAAMSLAEDWAVWLPVGIVAAIVATPKGFEQ